MASGGIHCGDATRDHRQHHRRRRVRLDHMLFRRESGSMRRAEAIAAARERVEALPARIQNKTENL